MPRGVRLGDPERKMSQRTAATTADQQADGASSMPKSSARQPGKAGPVSEEELRRQQHVSPADVLRLEKATEGESQLFSLRAEAPPSLEGAGRHLFRMWSLALHSHWSSGYLCPPAANVYNIDFVRFKIRDLESGATLFEVTKSEEEDEEIPSEPPRYVKYNFPPQFLKLKRIGAT